MLTNIQFISIHILENVVKNSLDRGENQKKKNHNSGSDKGGEKEEGGDDGKRKLKETMCEVVNSLTLYSLKTSHFLTCFHI